MAKKKHWTQTPAGRKKMAEIARKKTIKSEKKEDKNVSLETHAAYLFGKVETIIEYYASSNRLPKSTLAERVASLLRH